MFCTKCGTRNSDETDVCASCGAPLKKKPGGVPTPPPGADFSEEQNTPESPRLDNIPNNEEDEYTINRFNFGALMYPTYYTIGNRIWRWAIVMLGICCLPFLFPVLFESTRSFESIKYYMIGIFVIRFSFSAYLGFLGGRLAWETGMFTGIQQFRDMQRVWNTIGILTLLGILLSLILMLPAFYIQKSIVSRHENNASSCVNKLKEISRGMQMQIAESGNLQGVMSEDEICHHVLPGFSKPEECIGMVKMKVDKACRPGSLQVRVTGEFEYEIKAGIDDRTAGEVCVTESGVSNTMNGPGMLNSSACEHEYSE